LALFFLDFQGAVNSSQIKAKLCCMGFSHSTYFRDNRVLPHFLSLQ